MRKNSEDFALIRSTAEYTLEIRHSIQFQLYSKGKVYKADRAELSACLLTLGARMSAQHLCNACHTPALKCSSPAHISTRSRAKKGREDSQLCNSWRMKNNLDGGGGISLYKNRRGETIVTVSCTVANLVV